MLPAGGIWIGQVKTVDWPIAIKWQISNSTRSDEPFQKLIYPIRYSQSKTFAVFDIFVCISFMCLRVHVDLIQPLAARNNKRCFVRKSKTKRRSKIYTSQYQCRINANRGPWQLFPRALLLTRDKDLSQPATRVDTTCWQLFRPDINTAHLLLQKLCQNTWLLTGWKKILYFRRPPEAWGPWHLPHLPHG